MTDKIFINAVKTLIANYFNNNVDVTDGKKSPKMMYISCGAVRRCRISRRWRQQLYRTECITK